MPKVRLEQYQDMIGRLFPKENGGQSLCKTVTFQVTDECNLACKYCYQINKGKRVLKFETAKKLIDMLLDNKNTNGYLEDSPGIVIEFIGGEPFLQIELIDKICDYFIIEAIKRKHPWATRYRFSICSNGVLYFDERVQRFLKKHLRNLSFSITIDGNKELHDSCRVFHNGKPSYDIAVAGANHYMNVLGGFMGSKITIAPENVKYLSDAIKHMVELGYTDINANCVYEKGWELEHARELYKQMCIISDYWQENDLYETHQCSLFSEDGFCPMDPEDNQNWCGGTGHMLAVDPDGRLFPCIRYMESSLGTEIEPIVIGDVDNGIGCTDCQRNWINKLKSITRKSQSTDECFNCKVAKLCAWCSAYCYQDNGDPNIRSTYICIMHKARALGNVYFWNNYYKANNINKEFINYLDEKDIKEITEVENNE